MPHRQRFDRDEMDELFAQGLTTRQVAARLGVTPSAIWQVLRRRDPEAHEHLKTYRREYQRQHKRAPCKGGCGRLVWTIGDRSGYCRWCLAREVTEGVRPDSLICARCEEWKPDFDFPRRRRAYARRGRSRNCRPCQTILRRDYRERHKVPCEQCGAPCLPPSEKGHGGIDRALCLACYRASEEFRETRERAVARSAQLRRKVAA